MNRQQPVQGRAQSRRSCSGAVRGDQRTRGVDRLICYTLQVCLSRSFARKSFDNGAGPSPCRQGGLISGMRLSLPSGALAQAMRPVFRLDVNGVRAYCTPVTAQCGQRQGTLHFRLRLIGISGFMGQQGEGCYLLFLLRTTAFRPVIERLSLPGWRAPAPRRRSCRRRRARRPPRRLRRCRGHDRAAAAAPTPRSAPRRSGTSRRTP